MFLVVNRGFSAGCVFALTAWAGVVGTAVYLLNTFFGDRFERMWTQLVGAILFAGGWFGMSMRCTTPRPWYVVYSSAVGAIVVAVEHVRVHPANYPTRMRSLGTGWTDGVGHLGAWGGS